MRLLGLLLVALLLTGCPEGGDGDSETSSPTSTAPTAPSTGPLTIGQGPCSLTIFIQGNPTVVRGDRGSTVTAGGITIIFGPTCSATTVPADGPPG